jgi:hypothetical protein
MKPPRNGTGAELEHGGRVFVLLCRTWLELEHGCSGIRLVLRNFATGPWARSMKPPGTGAELEHCVRVFAGDEMGQRS